MEEAVNRFLRDSAASEEAAKQAAVALLHELHDAYEDKLPLDAESADALNKVLVEASAVKVESASGGTIPVIFAVAFNRDSRDDKITALAEWAKQFYSKGE